MVLEYSIRNLEPRVIPIHDFGGITYGTTGWNSPDGEFEWQNPPDTDQWKLHFTYKKGDGPDITGRKRQEIEDKTLAELARIKWGFLCEAERTSNARMRRTLSPEDSREANRIKGRLEDIFDADNRLSVPFNRFIPN